MARHGLAMCICDTLYSLGVTYSMPTFTGPRQPGQAVPSSQAVPADMSRPLMGSQVLLSFHAKRHLHVVVSVPQPAPISVSALVSSESYTLNPKP